MKRQLCLLGAAALIPMGAMAAENNSEFSYTYLELDYVGLSIDGVGDSNDLIDKLDNGDGWGAQGSLSLGENFFVFANYSETEADTSFRNDANQWIPADTDITKLDLGLGYHMPVGDATDLVLRGAYTDADRDRFRLGGSGDASLDDLNDDSSDGYFVDAAIRTQLTSWLEGSLGARYFDIEENDGLGVIGNLLFEVAPGFGINLGFDAGDELATWVAGVRFSF